MPSQNTSVGLEIASRFIKAIQLCVGLVCLAINVIGGYSVYLLWTIDRFAPTAQAEVQSRLEMGWFAIAGSVVFGLIKTALAWVILAPIEARIQGVNLRDPEVQTDRTISALWSVGGYMLMFAFYISVPLLIAHFRFRHFQ